MKHIIIFCSILLGSILAQASSMTCKPTETERWTRATITQLPNSAQVAYQVTAWGTYLAADLLCNSMGNCVGFVNGMQVMGTIEFAKDGHRKSAALTVDATDIGIPAGNFDCGYQGQ